MSVSYGKKINGVLLLDKPSGISSNMALQQVKQIFNAKKAGYIGTLDPLATGMLPVCFGEATKLAQYLLDSDKRYRVTAKLGQRTNTYDAHGIVINERPININTSILQDTLQYFRGKIKQIPPMYSAIKYKSKPLYKYARQGIAVSRQARYIMIYDLQFICLEGNQLQLEIHCSKGTYVRTLIDDLGEKLGCGAHVIALRRLNVADYSIDRMITLNQLKTIKDPSLKPDEDAASISNLLALLMPIESIVSILPEINLISVIANDIKQGKKIFIPKLHFTGLVRVTEGKERRFFGLAEINNGFIQPRRLLVDS
ncbi:MAG: tRNA pseudouridine(55) synthase TruB [Candidatus Dasytiphilus stammeri]